MNIDFLQSLIRVPSMSGDHGAQREIQDMCLQHLRERGVAEQQLTVQRSRGERPWTLIATSENAPAVLFVCHTDTVPVSDAAEWSGDPFSGSLIHAPDNPHLHGRGSVDMKGGLAAALECFLHAVQHGLGAAVLLTSDEETGGHGAGDAAANLTIEMAPKLVVVPEATDNHYSRGHRGASWFNVTAHGRAAHGATPAAGINAIRLLAEEVIARLDEAPSAADDYLGVDTVNLGTITGGAAPNIVPDRASLALDVRTVAGGAAFREWLDKTPASIEVEQLFELPSLSTEQVPAVMSEFIDAGPMPYFTDGAMIQNRVGGAPIVIWGPGGGDQMHTIDEQLSLSSLEQSVANYIHVLEELS